MCFDEVRKTKAWNFNPLVSSVLYFASTQGNMHPINGDVVPVEKFPHSMLLDFSWLIAQRRAWGVFVLTSGSTSYPPKYSFQIGSCMEEERNVISVESWKDEEGNWRRWAIFRSEDLACYWLQSGWCAGGRALVGVLIQSNQSEKAWLWCHSGLTSPGNGSVHRQLMPGLLLWSQASQWKKMEEGAPALYGSFLS